MKPCLRLPRLLSLSALSLACLLPAAVHAEATTHKSKTDKSKSSSAKAKQAKPKKKAVAADDGEFANFSQWKEVNDFIDEMVARNGFDKAALQAVFNKARYIDTAIQLIKPAPSGRPKNWQAYRARFVEPKRINAGVDFWNEHELALSRAEAQYGVPAEIIVGIIGVETVYGRNTGNFRVLDAVTTLDLTEITTVFERVAEVLRTQLA